MEHNARHDSEALWGLTIPMQVCLRPMLKTRRSFSGIMCIHKHIRVIEIFSSLCFYVAVDSQGKRRLLAVAVSLLIPWLLPSACLLYHNSCTCRLFHSFSAQDGAPKQSCDAYKLCVTQGRCCPNHTGVWGYCLHR